MKNDKFAEIAASYSVDGGRGLIRPEPIAVNNTVTKLCPDASSQFAPEGKISNFGELKSFIAEQKELYRPFLQDFAPKPLTVEKRIKISEFSYSLNGGEKQDVTLPHYGGPCGEERAVYESTFTLDEFNEKCIVLCFKGVDYKADVFVNGEYVGSHEGFFSPFEFDITDIALAGENTLKVVVKNTEKMQFGGDKIYAATGLGWDDPYVGWHHCPSGLGIYNDVFVELREQVSITDVFSRVTESVQELWVECNSSIDDTADYHFSVSVYGQNFLHTEIEDLIICPQTKLCCGLNDTFTEAIMSKNGVLGKSNPLKLGRGYNRFVLPIEIKNPKLWDLKTPYLYKVIVKLFVGERLMSVKSRQFGIRYFNQNIDSIPKGCFMLNGREIRLMGANTMGFEQQDVLKGDFNQLIEDILLAKAANMNFWRITQRPVQEEIYDYCDRLGLMVQTDFPTFGCIRINQYCEVLRQTSEMEKLVRSHPCCIIDTYINEPFPNANNQPHRMLVRSELSELFKAMDGIIHMHNPERVIKHIDGDYDPPDDSMPDNHCYTMWYNSHGIDYGRLHKGYWMDVKPGWHYGCGEFGAEGLERTEMMDKYYPLEWLKEPFEPGNIVCCQTEAFYRFFYERPESRAEWISDSQKYQAFAVREMTTAFRRNKDMNSFALHLFIDAFPSGWQKAVMDCERVPKPAYFDYADCLSPVFCSIRSDRRTFFEKENIFLETYINNEGHTEIDEICYFASMDERAFASGRQIPCKEISQGRVALNLPEVKQRAKIKVYMGVFCKGKLLHYAEEEFSVFPFEEYNKPKTLIYEQYRSNKEEYDTAVKNGARLFITGAPVGTINICGKSVTISNCKMGSLYTGSRKTGHSCTSGLEKNDFGYFYDSALDRMSPIAESTFTADGVNPIITGANKSKFNIWQDENLCGEWSYGSGRVVLSLLMLDNKEQNPCVVKLVNQLNKFLHKKE